MSRILDEIINEIDRFLDMGPIEYVKSKVSGLETAIESFLGSNGDAEDSDYEDNFDESFDGDDNDELLQEASDFINDHMTEMQQVIVKTIKTVNPTDYTDQQKYFMGVFNLAGDACWEYIQDVFNDPGVSPELSEEITETMVKGVVIVVASSMFIEWALSQKHDRDSNNKSEQEV